MLYFISFEQAVSGEICRPVFLIGKLFTGILTLGKSKIY
jgi:hypothetical protein